MSNGKNSRLTIFEININQILNSDMISEILLDVAPTQEPYQLIRNLKTKRIY